MERLIYSSKLYHIKPPQLGRVNPFKLGLPSTESRRVNSVSSVKRGALLVQASCFLKPTEGSLVISPKDELFPRGSSPKPTFHELPSSVVDHVTLRKKINNIKNSKVVVEDHEELKTQLKIKNNKLMAENEELKEKVKMMKLTKEEKLKEPHDNESRLEEMRETIYNWLDSNNRALDSCLEEMWKSISNWLESLESRLEEMRESISIRVESNKRALEENLNKLKVELDMKYEQVTETECSQHEQQRTLLLKVENMCRELKAEKDAMVKRVANLEKLCEQLILKKANVEDVKGVEDKVEIVLDLFNKEIIMANNDYDYDKCSIDDCSYCRNGGRRSPCQIDDDFYQYDRMLVPR